MVTKLLNILTSIFMFPFSFLLLYSIGILFAILLAKKNKKIGR